MVTLPKTAQTPIGLTPVPGRANTSAVPNAIAQFGKSVGEVGDDLQVAVDAQNRRTDVIEQARARETFAEKSRDLFLKEQNQGTNFEDPEALGKYNQSLVEEQTKILQNFKGTANGAAALTATLEGMRGRSHAQATVTGRQSQHEAITRQTKNFTSTLSEEAADQPERLDDIIVEFEVEIGKYVDGMTPTQFRALHDDGVSEIVGSAVKRSIDLGNLESARAMFERAKPVLTAVDRHKFNTQIVALEGATLRKGAEKAARRARVVATVGEENMTPAIELALEGINLPKPGPLTVPERIAEHEALMTRATGKPYRATPREVGAITGTHKKLGDGGRDKPFGGGAVGSAQAHLATQHQAFRDSSRLPDGTLNEADSLFLAAVAIASRPNEITGIPGTLTPPTKEALRSRGFDPKQLSGFPVVPPPAQTPAQAAAAQPSVPQLTPPAAAPQVTPPPVPGQGTPGGPQAADPAFAEPGSDADKPFTLGDAAEESRRFVEEGGLLAPQARLPAETIYGTADLLTGPVSGFRGAGARVPLLGGIIEDPLTTRARTSLPIIANDLLKILANNPKYAVTERTDLKEIVKLESKFFDRPENLRQQIIGLDTALEIREKNARETLASEAVTRIEAGHALNVLNGIVKFRKILGAPPLVQNAAEAKTLPRGAPFRIPGSTTIMYNRPKGDKQ